MRPRPAAPIVRGVFIIFQRTLPINGIVDMQVFGRSEDGTGDAVQDHEVSPTATTTDTSSDHKAILKLAFNGIPGRCAGLHAYKVVGTGQSLIQVPRYIARPGYRCGATLQTQFTAGHFALCPWAEKRIESRDAG